MLWYVLISIHSVRMQKCLFSGKRKKAKICWEGRNCNIDINNAFKIMLVLILSYVDIVISHINCTSFWLSSKMEHE